MNRLKEYIKNTLGASVNIRTLPKKGKAVLPLYIKETYDVYVTELFNRKLILIKDKNNTRFKALQTRKNIDLVKKVLNKNVILVLTELEAYNRKRLIEQGVNFIVLNKQMYMPDLLIDLRDINTNGKSRNINTKLLPSAQFLLIFHIIHKNNQFNIEDYSFKEIAKITGYTPMAISKAVENLKILKLVTVTGEKQKQIKFNYTKSELWHTVNKQNLLINPVIKKVFVDEKPESEQLPYSNNSALPEYTDMNPTKQVYYAMDKNKFYHLQRNDLLKNPNDTEGQYCLEIWKYNPVTLLLKYQTDNFVIDPLSLYISLEDVKDERVEMALEQIIEKQTW